MVGAGYVGLTTAACLSDLGNDVWVVDIDQAKVDWLRAGRIPFYEPGLQELVDRNTRAGRMHFTTSYAEAIPGSEFAFIAVSTPEGDGGEADLSSVRSAAAAIAEHMSDRLIIVNKSTVPIGTGDLVSTTVKERNGRHPAAVVSNPEFLREGSALKDFMEPDRIVIGAHDEAAAAQVAKLYEPLPGRLMVTDIYSAEMIKYASNAFLATRISFMNEVARIAERVNADIKVVSEGMGLDHRIGPHFLEAGLGYGGSCFPKDVKALTAIGEHYGYHPELLRAVMDINRDQRKLVVDKVRECLGDLAGRVIGLLGLSFKPNTDDMREAPSVDIARQLIAGGASVAAYDPAAMERARPLLPEVRFEKDPYALADGAHGLILVTEWNEFKQLDLARIKGLLREPVLVDGRNLYDPADMRRLGFVYRAVGRN